MTSIWKGPLAALAALAAGSCSEPPPWSSRSGGPSAAPGGAPATQQAATTPAKPSKPPPPGAAPARHGECYARVHFPAQYRTRTQVVEVQPETERVETVPAQFVWEERRFEVAPARRTLRVIPATYRWVEERVLVEPELAEMRALPARLETRSERVLMAPARQIWRPGRGAIERVDERTGEIQHRVDVPALYRTVTRTVEVEPARAARIVIRPAQYRIVRRAVIDRPARTVEEDLPAQYETVRIRTQSRPEELRRVVVPAVTKRVSERILEAPARTEWRAILCHGNVTTAIVAKVLRELAARGFDPGPVTGRLDARTAGAIQLYQATHGLARGPLTYETIEHLGVALAASAKEDRPR